VFDLDHTLCDTKKKEDGNWDYIGAEPFLERILKVNEIYELGNEVIIETARGCVSGKDWYDPTFQQLKKWGLKFPKGASAAVLEAARTLVHQHGPDALRATAKLHFKTTQQALA
jgi:hypothetical protein